MAYKIECINFDLDSVLYVPSVFIETTLLMSIKVMIETGLKAEPAEALERIKEIRARDSNAEDHFDQLCLHFNGTFDPLIVAAGVERYWDCKIGMLTSVPETSLILSAFFRKYPLSIVSNGPPLKQAGKVVRLGLSHFFSQYDAALQVQKHFFYSTSERLKIKPYPHLWQESQKDIGYCFDRAVMVGDRFWNDIFGAKRLGMTTVKVNQGPYARDTIDEAFERAWQGDARDFFSRYHSEEEARRLMKPDYTIHSLKELEETILEIERVLES